MTTRTLEVDIRTVDHKTLIESGGVLTDEVLTRVVNSNIEPDYTVRSLMRHDTIRKDLSEFLNTPPYDIIFSTSELIEDLYEEMSTVELPAPLLDTITHFKSWDPYSYRHFLVVFTLSTLLSRDLVPDYNARVMLAATGPVHDIGKMCVPLEYLQKRTPLTANEKKALDAHTTAGYVLLSYYHRDTGTLAPKVARDHHERRDGSGYPTGANILDPLLEIIIACDIYDALVSPRPYRRRPFDNRSALEELSAMAEAGRIGWNVVRALVGHNRTEKTHYSLTWVSTAKRGTQPEGNVYGITIEDDPETVDKQR